MKASVIICTYNRADLLKDSIRSIQNQDFPSNQFEIIIVDNNSTDNTKVIIDTITASSPVIIKYCFEKRQGLSSARNRGIAEAKGEIIAFIDDDSIAEKQWLSNLISAYDDPEVACVGGRIELLWLDKKPEWLTTSVEISLGKLDYGDTVKELKFPQVLFGGNISFRQIVLNKVGNFSTNLGRDTRTLLSNEESELIARIEKDGWIIKYVPTAVIYHKVMPERLKKLWFYHRAYWQGRSDAILDSNMKADVLARIRKHATAMVWRKIKKKEDEFDIRCYDRYEKGYFYQLLFPQKNNNIEDNFRKLRVLEVFLAEITKASSELIIDRDNKIIDRDNKIIDRDNKIIDRDNKIIDRDNKINELLKYIDEKHNDLKQLNMTLKQKEDKIKELLNSWSWKLTVPLRTIGDLFKKRK